MRHARRRHPWRKRSLVVAEPLALCALVATLSRMQRCGRDVQVVGLSSPFKQQLEDLDILSRTLHLANRESRTGYQGTLHAYRVRSERVGNEVGNKIAGSIASLVPSSQVPISAFEPPQQNKAIALPLAYVFTELIDNGPGRRASVAGIKHGEFLRDRRQI